MAAAGATHAVIASDGCAKAPSAEAISWAPGSAWIDAYVVGLPASSENAATLRDAAALIGGELMEGLSIEEAGFEQWLAAERERFRLFTGRIYARLLEQSELSCCGLRARKTTSVFLSSFKRLACQRETSHNAQLPHM
jgi:hypothetical protein